MSKTMELYLAYTETGRLGVVVFRFSRARSTVDYLSLRSDNSISLSSYTVETVEGLANLLIPAIQVAERVDVVVLHPQRVESASGYAEVITSNLSPEMREKLFAEVKVVGDE